MNKKLWIIGGLVGLSVFALGFGFGELRKDSTPDQNQTPVAVHRAEPRSAPVSVQNVQPAPTVDQAQDQSQQTEQTQDQPSNDASAQTSAYNQPTEANDNHTPFNDPNVHSQWYHDQQRQVSEADKNHWLMEHQNQATSNVDKLVSRNSDGTVTWHCEENGSFFIKTTDQNGNEISRTPTDSDFNPLNP